MKVHSKAFIVLTLIFWNSLTADGQRIVPKYQIGMGAGAFVYQGDLTPERLGAYKTLKPSFNFYLNRIISPLIMARTQLALGGLKGDDAKYATPEYRQQRNFNFKTPVFEFSELVIADLLRDNMSKQFFGLSPYVFSGIGFTFLRIKRDYSMFNNEYFAGETTTIEGLAADAQHQLPTLIPVIPVGVGIKFPVSEKFLITAETSYRFTFTDYIDGFSKAANPAKKDSYQSHTIGIVYRPGTNNVLKCPVF